MKVKLTSGGGCGYGPDGVMTSWAPGTLVDVADDDKAAVAFYRGWVDAGIAKLVEEPAKPAPPAVKTAPAAPVATGPVAPPLGGPGSGREAWAAYADALGVGVDDDMTRDDIVDAIESES